MSEASKQLQTHQEQLDADGIMVGVSRQAVDEVLDEWKEARDWLDACMGMVDGRGPPNWDGIRDFLKRTDTPPTTLAK